MDYAGLNVLAFASMLLKKGNNHFTTAFLAWLRTPLNAPPPVSMFSMLELVQPSNH